MPRDLTPVLNRLCAEVPAATTAVGFKRDICILSTRIAVDALREVGIRARPLACHLAVYNAAYIARVSELGRPLEPDELVGDVWSLGIGPDEARDGRYNGHVIAIVDERYGLDLTLDQASRPAKNINLHPAHFSASRAFLRGDEPYIAQVKGCYVRYLALPEEKGYLRAGDWTEVRRLGRLNPTPRVVRALAA